MKIFAISGLGADRRVYDYLTLEHELIPIDWIKPEGKEGIEHYSKRLIDLYNIGVDEDFGLMGVSFGGLIAVEIAKQHKPKFTILVSSVETKDELSALLKLVGKSRLLEILPEKLFNPPKALAHFMFGTDKKELLNSILDDADLGFTKWAISQLLNWQNETKIPHLIKIGGSKDKMLPPEGENITIIDQGEHFMIVDRAQEISKVLNEKIKEYA